jgi:hypothetical protein
MSSGLPITVRPPVRRVPIGGRTGGLTDNDILAQFAQKFKDEQGDPSPDNVMQAVQMEQLRNEKMEEVLGMTPEGRRGYLEACLEEAAQLKKDTAFEEAAAMRKRIEGCKRNQEAVNQLFWRATEQEAKRQERPIPSLPSGRIYVSTNPAPAPAAHRVQLQCNEDPCPAAVVGKHRVQLLDGTWFDESDGSDDGFQDPTMPNGICAFGTFEIEVPRNPIPRSDVVNWETTVQISIPRSTITAPLKQTPRPPATTRAKQTSRPPFVIDRNAETINKTHPSSLSSSISFLPKAQAQDVLNEVFVNHSDLDGSSSISMEKAQDAMDAVENFKCMTVVKYKEKFLNDPRAEGERVSDTQCPFTHQSKGHGGSTVTSVSKANEHFLIIVCYFNLSMLFSFIL